MRFWIILIIVIGGCTAGVFVFLNKVTTAEDDTTSTPTEKKATAGFLTTDRNEHAKQEKKELPPAIIARNSVKFKHRPVPSIEQLDKLTSSSKNSRRGNNKETSEQREVIAVPDIPTNTVMLYGNLIEVERLAEALRSMDQVINTCHLKTWVVFVRGDKSKGFDLVASIVSGKSSSLTARLGGGIFNTSLGVDRLQLGLTASASQGILEIVDQPYMQLLHGTKSTISTVEEIAIPTTTTSQGVTETSIEYKQVGLTLDVTPWFLDKERVRLQVEQKNGVVGATRSIGGSDIPELSTQSLITSAELRMGQVIVLGGVESSEREKRRGWFTKKDERKLGHLYIVAAIYSTIPKARPVIDLAPDYPLNPRTPPRDRRPWSDGVELLPSLPPHK